jgi:PPK2 family polyphosphate:nucleotide phosphotransferase
MLVKSPYLVEPDTKKVHLHKWSTDETGPFKDADECRIATEKDTQRLIDLQELLYADGQHALLIVFQAMDAGGKDGAISHVFSGVNPQGCDVTSFKQPTPLELRHDFLWRVHAAVPPKGMIVIFNRSHYESVLVERVHNLVPEKVWSRRYEQINSFEKLLAKEGTTILKFFLHISKDEQRRRLQARLDDKKKIWKLQPTDIKERGYWDQYQNAYEDALANCSTKHGPWFVVPSDRKWFRNWVISDVIVRALQKMDLNYPKPAPGLKLTKIV